jgi:transcriptional regulator with XRE-family HTH domain
LKKAAGKKLSLPPASSSKLSSADATANLLNKYLGSVIREQRLSHQLKIAEVAKLAGISRGMLSKIENGQAATSLETLSRIANTLGVSLAYLFRNYNVPTGGAQLVKNGQGMEVVRRGTKRGHTYHLLAYDQGPQKLFEPFLITMDDESEVFPTFEHPGMEFIHMQQGKIEYRHGQHTYTLGPGDSLTFRGDIPHGPERLIKLPIKFLAIIFYGTPVVEDISH